MVVGGEGGGEGENVGHLGKEINVAGIHGHNRIHGHTVSDAFWDRLSLKLRVYGTHFFAGDFNMWMTQVVPQLRIHNGAHFPHCMFTDNSSSRSKEAEAKRKANKGN